MLYSCYVIWTKMPYSCCVILYGMPHTCFVIWYGMPHACRRRVMREKMMILASVSRLLLMATTWQKDPLRPNHTSCRKLLMKLLVKDFKHTLRHKAKEFSLKSLITWLRIEEETRKHDQKEEVNDFPKKKSTAVLKPNLKSKGNEMKVQN
ncbi:uncharacterized protein E5676_scaffold609G00640 [Cucumis melo var. makuwa]|uniref:Uncharacterized protein n=1 Tax=Cucumis melo var. makuwa TaxID=1194695 RepID=A0A5D3DCV5_CUCMM|nr:uncharacterized protein E6C27_scaffold60G002560 [Cucumis melo var. makuwa]TYK21414.1 uncharacterized protein E5676_scaffold609G00640 [Cucumis melo var. makuwa]